MKPTAGKKAVYSLIGFFAVGALGFFAGAGWSYVDEHSGRSAKAKVTHCERHGAGRGTKPHCTGRWSVDGREQTGPVYNAKPGDVGKTLSVRLHGTHASRPRLWVSLGLAVMGMLVAGVAVMLVVQLRRRAEPT